MSKEDEIKALKLKTAGNMKKVSPTTAALFGKQLIFSNIGKLRLFKNHLPKFLLKSLRKVSKLIISCYIRKKMNGFWVFIFKIYLTTAEISLPCHISRLCNSVPYFMSP